MGSKTKTDPGEVVQLLKKKHSKVTSSVDPVLPDSSHKKKKHSKNKEMPESDFVSQPSKKNKQEAVKAVFQKSAQEEAAVSKKKKKLTLEKEEPVVPIMAPKSPKKSSKSEEAQALIAEVVKSPSKKRSRAEKEMEVLQSPKKKHKKIEEVADDAGKDSDSPPEHTELTKEHQVEKKKSNMIDLWPTEDMQTLFNRIRSAIPPNDKLVFKTRQENIDWNSIAFGDYSGEDCKAKWLLVVKQLRGFRLLSELVDDAVVWMEKPWTKYNKKNSKQHHPDMPQRPLSTYMMFYMENKDRVKAENPGIPMTALSSIISKEYKSLPEKEKKRYDDMFAAKKQEYLEQMEIFEKNHPEIKAQTHRLAPKKSRTPLQIFMDDRLKKYENTGLNLVQVRDDAREKFKTLSDKKRLKWIKKAVEEYKTFKEQLKQYSDSHPDFQAKKTSILNRHELELLLKDAGKPVEPPKAGSRLFLREEYPLEIAKGTPTEEAMRVLNKRWSDLSASEKQHYKNRCLEERKQYLKAYEEYVNSLDDEHKEYEEILFQMQNKKGGKKKTSDDESPAEKEKKMVFKGEPIKPPSSAFELFAKDFAKTAGFKTIDARALWDSLPETDKNKFAKKQKESVQKYMVKLEQFLKNLDKEQLAAYRKYRGIENATKSSDGDSNHKKQPSAAKSKEPASSSDSESDSEESEDEEKSETGSGSESSSESEKEEVKESSDESESEEEQEEKVTNNNNVVIKKPPASSSSDSDSDSD